MTSRREFIQASAALSIAATTSDSYLPEPSRSIDLVVFDERYDECRRFAREGQARGCAAFATGRDITPLWFASLEPLLDKRRRAIAGLNDQSSVFVLERLAWEKGFHLTYRGEHTLLANGSAVHLSRSPNLAGSMPLREDRAWPTSIAKFLVSLPSQFAAPGQCSRLRPIQCSGEMLVSWLLAPRPRGSR